MRHKKYSSIIDLADRQGDVSLEAFIELQESLKVFRGFENSQNYAARFCTSAQQMLQSVGLWQHISLVPTRAFFNIYDEVIKQEIGLTYLRPAPIGCGFLGLFSDCFSIESFFDSSSEGKLIVTRIPNIQMFEKKTFSMAPYVTLIDNKEVIRYLPRFSRKHL